MFMPQPVNLNNAHVFNISGTAPSQYANVEILATAYCIILQSSNIDWCKMNIYILMMGGKHTDAAKIYLDQTSATQKNKTIATLAKDKLSKENFDALTALINKTTPLTKARDKLCHWAPFKHLPLGPIRVPLVSVDLDLVDPVGHYKNRKPKKVSGFFKYKHTELTRHLNDANKIGAEWVKLEAKIRTETEQTPK